MSRHPAPRDTYLMPNSVDVSHPRTADRVVDRRLWIDLVIAIALLVGSGVWAARFLTVWRVHGGVPIFYQAYFEPAVMIACGKGFVAADAHRPPSLDDFLARRSDTFDCRDIRPDLKLGQGNLAQRPWRYLLFTVGWSWRMLGVSWNGLGPLFGLLFGATIVLAYAIFRLGMGRPLAVIGALGLTISSAHLTNLPHLRDYAKAPFTLALILILALLVTRPLQRWTVLALACAYGLVLGVGYGFRTDFLADLPVFLIVVCAFLPGGLTRNLRLKAASALLFVATFLVVSWPITSAVYKDGGCQWHVALLGLQSPFDNGLRVAPAPYDFGYAYADSYIHRTVADFARRTPPGVNSLAYCSHEYDVASWKYLEQLLVGFPADFATRAYGSTLQIVELPFLWWSPPTKGWMDALYQERTDFLRPQIGAGRFIVVAALLLMSAISIRLALFLLFFVVYFGGYSAVQFHDRHHFHLEFITWWALGFLVQQGVTAVQTSIRDVRLEGKPILAGLRRMLVFGAAASVLIVVPLKLARWYQGRQARSLFEAYLHAPKQPLALPPAAGQLIEVSPPTDLPTPRGQFLTQFLEVDLNAAACGGTTSVTFRYDRAFPEADFSRTVTLAGAASAPGMTSIFITVFERFKGLELSEARPGCLVSAYRLTDPHFPVQLDVTLPPEWKRLPMYQRLRPWEGN